ncbi:hypothetical protein [Sulfuritalea hydrogenivorans]|nr:hypothetical protein [Sulfuritalea hydrogenivorans]
MIVQSTSAHYSGAGIARSLTPRQTPITTPANVADTINISIAAREAFASSGASSTTASVDKSVEARLAAIKSKDGMSRTQEEQDYVRANDKRLAEITAQGKPPEKLTADELDYVQKAAGFVNTFGNLSPAEKALYDKAVASGNTEAAAGISQIALIRQGGNMAGGANGTTYNPLTMEITAANIEKFFSHSIVDPSGNAQSRFDALIQFLQENPVA